MGRTGILHRCVDLAQKHQTRSISEVAMMLTTIDIGHNEVQLSQLLNTAH